MADTFKTDFAISDKLILLNLHNAAYKKMKPIKDFKINLPGQSEKDKKEVVECHQVHDKIGDITNSGCKNNLKGPDKETFQSPTSIYELGVVFNIGTSDDGTTKQDASTSMNEFDDKQLNEIAKQLQKEAITPIRSYLIVFVGKDAGNKIKDGDIEVIHYSDAERAAIVNKDYTIGDKKREDNEFGYALCKVKYSIGLEKK